MAINERTNCQEDVAPEIENLHPLKKRRRETVVERTQQISEQADENTDIKEDGTQDTQFASILGRCLLQEGKGTDGNKE